MLTIVIATYLAVTLLLVLGLCSAASRTMPLPGNFVFDAAGFVRFFADENRPRPQAPSLDRKVTTPKAPLTNETLEARLEKDRLFEE